MRKAKELLAGFIVLFCLSIAVALWLSSIFSTNLAAISPSENGKLDFALLDALGRDVRSQDYKGVPVFLEFGACW